MSSRLEISIHKYIEKSSWFHFQCKILVSLLKTFFVGFSLVWGPACAQQMAQQELHLLTHETKVQSLHEFREFLALPNYGRHSDQVRPNLEWCRSRFIGLDFKVKEIETDGMPLLMAEKIIYPDRETVLFYLQIDGQPVNDELWDQKNPYQAVIKKKEVEGRGWETIEWSEINETINPDWHVFARSTADAKGPALAFIKALDILEDKKIQPEFNIKVIMDFQEELGSPDLPKAVEKNRQLLKSDYLVIMDGVRSISNVPTLTFGARGNTTLELTVYGPKKVLHSGHYGNYAPNPVFSASHLIASMKNEKGLVLVPGFYDGVQIDDALKIELDKVPEDRYNLLKEMGVAATESIGETYQEAMQYPSLNIRGIQAGWVGKNRRTIIPDKVIVEIDMRLVKETSGERQVRLIRKHIESQGFYVIEGKLPTEEERSSFPKLASLEYTIGSKPFVTEFGGTIDSWLTNALEKATGTKPLRIRMTGGSQPIAPFINTLNIPAVAVRLGNPDANHHAPNENLRVGNFFEGILTCMGILTEKLNNSAN